MTARVFRHEILVNDQPQRVKLTGDPLSVGLRAVDVVEFWVEHDDQAQPAERAFQVFGTGHPLPDGARWWGTAPRTPEGLVWHLYEVTGR